MNENEKENDYNVKLKFFGVPKLIPYIKPYIPMILFMILLGILGSFIDSVYPLFNRYALDNFVAGKTLKHLTGFIILYVLVVLLQVIINFVAGFLGGKVEMSVDRDLRNAAFNHLQELSFAYFNQNNVGYIHARVMSDTGKIGVMVAWRLMDIVWNGAYIVSVFVMMLILNVRMALYIIVLVPIAAVTVTYFQKKLIVLNRKIREINSRITSNFNEGITGAKAIKTLVVEDRIQKEFEEETEKYRKTSVYATHNSAFFASAITMLSTFALALVLWKGGAMTIEGVLQLGTLSVFLTYALEMMEPIQNVIVTFADLISVQVNVERFTKLICAPVSF